MKQNKNKNAAILLAILVALSSVFYKNQFSTTSAVGPTDPSELSPKIDESLKKIEQIGFDTGILNDPKFSSFESIESALPTVSKGRTNPFATILGK
ncbi:MAG: hypothetical protein AAB392_00355 [Patescibacteria group bacterium]